ncbi:MAG TPA: glycosyltransferase, partial [Myxococcaceae bacterium]|nr:glycosyltransferase [Myxococcaceae bacterium]
LPQARLLIVGRGEALADLQAEVAHDGLQRNVIFAGYRSGAQLAAAYRTLDAKVLLAEGNDGTCRAMLEAMACGRPVIAYRFGAPAEVIADGVTGKLVDTGDLGGLKSALLKLLSDRALCTRMGAAARSQVATFTQAARGEAVERFLADVLALPPASAKRLARTRRTTATRSP